MNFNEAINEEVLVNWDVDENTKESEKCRVSENTCVGNRLTGKPQKCES